MGVEDVDGLEGEIWYQLSSSLRKVVVKGLERGLRLSSYTLARMVVGKLI